MTLRAAAPAPTTATRAPATSTPASPSEATKPSPSVLWPTSRAVGDRTTVLTDRSADAAGDS